MGTWNELGSRLVHIQYTYFADVERWKGQLRSTDSSRFCQRTFAGSDRLLMSDWAYAIPGWIGANHYRNRSRVSSPTALSGLNQLFGDGRVAWRTITQDEWVDWQSLSSSRPSVETSPGGWKVYFQTESF